MTTTPRKIAFIGAGNMTQSIVGGMVRSGYSNELIYVSNPSAGKLQLLQDKLKVHTSQDNIQVATQADVIVLAVKPQLMAQVCQQLREQVPNLSDKLIVTIAAGIRIEKYRQYLGDSIRMIRVMPNTPSLVGQGMSGLVADDRVDQTDQDFITAAFNGVGATLWVADEDQLDILGAVAGSGPAYFFEFMASLQKAAAALGFDADKARAMVQQTALGAAEMAIASELSLEDLRKQVTSKGGSTAKGIEVYQAAEIDKISAQAVKAAVQRNQEMAKLF
ncbi:MULTISPECIES: pyrroline-5-carboxylate reductase [Idiomarinaceae]|uniref:Pyrroline-5-carboxylate reductase n=1 Tax=Pseudidiomarina fusca TaxID=2965078 RepID=A0ABU3KXV1_9GAMM|nr:MULTISPECIES: pyrroline-5-carboxylate reductase [Idiomarinaceae]MDT7526275.1 pyrroline-5-carboxylate reductase [Pseudidiomarina sp. GXY010]MRJ43052.1 pyrroline-5-carboxylate reductase [Idiomarina sp. FeN1]NCU58234.1 pyrroline-5-carboxylate reductase [Idiomarina sp. FenA--70]NCU60932.1 pyrroline-5-carboxylate reductase [Idiomarina sp. FenBw--71]UUN14003.1 pyrroline-5-carboxylate reductase [Idiomarina loihiensis]